MPPAVAFIVVAICTFEHPAVPFNTTFILFAGSAPAGVWQHRRSASPVEAAANRLG